MLDTIQTRSVSERLADWATELEPGALPSATREKARDILVDIVGLCIAARNTDYVNATRQAVEPGHHTVIGHAFTASAQGAALVNGTAAHGEDFDDTFEGGPVHSGVVIVPALLAAAETWKLDNASTMLGISAGCELLCRLALTVPKAVHKAGFHPTAVLGTFAATFGICVACRASENITVNALGIAGSMASGIIEYLGDGSWTKRMHPGWSAQSALRAYSLARAGFIGPRQVFEGTHGAFTAFAPSVKPAIDHLFEDLGTRFVSDTITFKPYPCGTMIQPYIDCAIALRRSGAPLEGIRSITCKTAEGIVHRLWEPLPLKRLPPTAYAAKFSVPFGVALGLARGRADLGDYTEATIADPALTDIAGKVGFEIDPANPYPKAFTGHVRITYEDGGIVEHEQNYMRGGAAHPLTRAEINAKFAANLAFGNCAESDRLLSICDGIAAGEGDYSDIAGLGIA
ncbi:2-methylcitrate dehydratase [Paramesorhizobium deserti]|uniref:2-methylcitrate dehydratase n=1 Tax=Paramesorhizobium deserti TaxID=1494590 RepID=A0A135HNU6_9HYPH|nr:MmgE/PrpD family protein [Paramesorhizobium deserti]KXF74888.1 2-methylcitrate dehydratase [Paramesorhizobium deserti]